MVYTEQYLSLQPDCKNKSNNKRMDYSFLNVTIQLKTDKNEKKYSSKRIQTGCIQGYV